MAKPPNAPTTAATALPVRMAPAATIRAKVTAEISPEIVSTHPARLRSAPRRAKDRNEKAALIGVPAIGMETEMALLA